MSNRDRLAEKYSASRVSHPKDPNELEHFKAGWDACLSYEKEWDAMKQDRDLFLKQKNSILNYLEYELEEMIHVAEDHAGEVGSIWFCRKVERLVEILNMYRGDNDNS